MVRGTSRAGDFEGYVALRRVADEVQAPFSVEYWKSSPYFINFLRDYRVGEHLRAALRTRKLSDRLRPLLLHTQRITKSDVDEFRQLEWANARLRSLAEETLSQGWWRLLWMPPSLPYHSLGGPYESVDLAAMTKQLIFTSWIAAPTAIASLLSYEVQRQIVAGDGNLANTPAARAAISNRLDYRMVDERPASMSVLALFWPQPALASLTDPLEAARESTEPPSAEDVIEWASHSVEPTDPWAAVFEAAASDDDDGLGGLTPYWMYPGDAHLQRRVMALPLSRDQKRWDKLQDSLALYRLAFGQPRQEDMLAALQRRGMVGQPERIAEIRIDLRPPARARPPRHAHVEGLGSSPTPLSISLLMRDADRVVAL